MRWSLAVVLSFVLFPVPAQPHNEPPISELVLAYQSTNPTVFAHTARRMHTSTLLRLLSSDAQSEKLAACAGARYAELNVELFEQLTRVAFSDDDLASPIAIQSIQHVTTNAVSVHHAESTARDIILAIEPLIAEGTRRQTLREDKLIWARTLINYLRNRR